MKAERRSPHAWWGPGMDAFVGVAVFFLLWLLLGTSVLSRISFGQDINPLTAGEITQYWVVAGVTFAILLFAFVMALRQDRVLAIAIYPFVAIAMVIVVLVFAIPPITRPADPGYPTNPNGCHRTDSENCPGG